MRINKGFSWTEKTLTFPHFYNKSEDNTKLKAEFALFKRVFYINLSYTSFGNSMSVLEDIKTLQLKLNWFSIWSKSLEESELVSSSEYYKSGVGSFSYIFQEYHELSDKFFENINKINPKALSLEF